MHSDRAPTSPVDAMCVCIQKFGGLVTGGHLKMSKVY